MTPSLDATPELAWLRRRVHEVSWHAVQSVVAVPPASAKVKETLSPQTGAVLVKPSIQRFAPANTRSLPTVERGPASPQGMSVDEYNTWRGQQRHQALPYVHQEYPKMLYKDGCAPCTVVSAVEHLPLQKAGWLESPAGLQVLPAPKARRGGNA